MHVETRNSKNVRDEMHVKHLEIKTHSTHQPTDSLPALNIFMTLSTASFPCWFLCMQTQRLQVAADHADLGCESPIDSYRPLSPSPFIIITEPESWYSIYHPTEDGRLWPMISTFELDLYRIEMNQHAKCQHFKGHLVKKIIVRTHTHTHSTECSAWTTRVIGIIKLQ